MWFNPIVTWLLRSPIHSLVSKGTMLLTVTGSRSGRLYSTPINYLREENRLWVISWRDRTWWRNLRGGAPMQVLLAGEELEGQGLVIEEVGRTAKSLSEYIRKAPQMARYFNVKVDKKGQPKEEDCAEAAEKMVMVRIDLDLEETQDVK